MKTLFGKLIIICLAVAGPSVQNCLALPAGSWSLSHSSSATYQLAGGNIMVESNVYNKGAAEYLYTYQIDNVSSNLGLSFLSIPILPGATAWGADYDLALGTVLPSDWTLVHSPTQIESANANFRDTIDNNGIKSAILWFHSSQPWTDADAALFGFKSGVPYYSDTPVEGNILTPIPEPITLSLLAVGAMFIKRKSN